MLKQELQRKIGERILEIRTKQSLSQTDLAYMCGWDRQVLHKIEKGKVNCTIYILYIIATELKISLSDLLNIE